MKFIVIIACLLTLIVSVFGKLVERAPSVDLFRSVADKNQDYEWKISEYTNPVNKLINGHNYIMFVPLIRDKDGNLKELPAKNVGNNKYIQCSYRIELLIQSGSVDVEFINQPIKAKLMTTMTMQTYTEPRNGKLLNSFYLGLASPLEIKDELVRYTSEGKFKDGKTYFFGFKDCQSFSHSFYSHLKREEKKGSSS